ncbi:unnamed protein product [Penicillium salamii]|uniref:FR47-like domain-containing protein n=1 Tax=Penicillium salamii TaxID=1612424 RepID=A0A9W4J929_9EURO|nr:unnamed protein product [Penicillium salamii]CAG7990472.1 unnamed protein product [Penicillium salamii]CAG8273335.1 unnamed protein product [Penicillium salamii]CAG8354167.1 unnamed protein product [Penicillium salamii]CAG8357668.1 unnamed protein product [Penicillium salamii]
MQSDITIYQHDAATLMPALVSQLPYSLTLLRRIQHGIAFPFETAQLLATFPPGSAPNPETPWLAARVDLFRGRETQMFIYSSLEAEHTSIQPIDAVSTGSTTAAKILKVDFDSLPQSTNNNPGQNNDNSRKPIVASFSASQAILDLARTQLLAFLSYVKTHLLPVYLSSLESSAAATSTAKTQTSSAPNSNTIPIRSGTYTTSDPIPNIRVHRLDDPPYYKYFFRRSDFGPEEQSRRSGDHGSADSSLPVGYRFRDREGREGVHSWHLDLVQSRTSIPRSRAQLSTMPSVAVYRDSEPVDNDADEQPIAWGFLGMDGSLATLHVEPEHRGRGLALPLSKEIMCRGMAPDGLFGPRSFEFDSQTQDRVGAWAHSDVSGVNAASRRVMEKIGGQVLTTVTWSIIELCD